MGWYYFLKWREQTMNSYWILTYNDTFLKTKKLRLLSEPRNEDYKMLLTSATHVTMRTPGGSSIRKTHLYCGTHQVLNATEKDLILYTSLKGQNILLSRESFGFWACYTDTILSRNLQNDIICKFFVKSLSQMVYKILLC